MDPEELQRAGWLLGADAPRTLEYVDPIVKDDVSTAVAVKRHPTLLLLERPEVWGVVDRFLSGVCRKVTPREYARMSCFEVDLVLTMRAAHGREERRYIESLRRKREEEGQG